MDVTEIQKYLPHRYPFLLVDRVLELEPEKRILAIKNITINEAFPGSFPSYARLPWRAYCGSSRASLRHSRI